MEKGEVKGSLTLRSLEKAAEALNCTLIYALVPNRTLEEMVHAQAKALASERLAAVEHSMQLENQAVPASDLGRQVLGVLGSPSVDSTLIANQVKQARKDFRNSRNRSAL